ncbi:MAG TPA: acyl-CoA dehydrogenase, partial [Burkholderiaceae bacterium]
LYTPLVKAYISDQAWRVCELAIQVHGGIGYIRDLPIEQYARDVKILSIWEGTNYIQAQDLVREKLAFGRDPVVMDQLGEDLRAFLAGVPAGLRAEAEAVDAAFAAVKWTLGAIGDWVRDRELQRVAQHATRFLEMLAQVVVAWSLLEGAAVASQALQAPALADDEREFYTGKLATARYFIHNCLPGVHTDALVMRNAASFVPVASASFGQSASASA